MIVLDRATLKDWGRLYAMRCDPDTVANSFSSPPVLWAHMEWLKSVIDSEKVLLFVARDTDRGVYIGSGRIELVPTSAKKAKSAHAELSLTVDPLQRGHGYGTEIVAALLRYLEDPAQTSTLEARFAGKVTASVKPTNYASLRAFAACGFLPVKCYDDRIELELQR